MKVHGQCHCGAITYEAEVDPTVVNMCHCLDCQTLSGSAFRLNVLAPADTFRLLSGTPRQYIKTGASGAKRAHGFCEICGGPVYATDLGTPRTYTLRVGALAERDVLGPVRRQTWTRRRLKWLPKVDSPVECDMQP
ncbi:MAG: GFA family protein [Alcaligenaceae bacterium]|nr:GFA family protein [Alcaligenaceae bacterium SAGV5]MPS55412.1 GFA family protein [Alcaligenaceae bacterium SAGV3]MPT60103.1 GFA family protein [Alcaligenaceae bacterium]